MMTFLEGLRDSIWTHFDLFINDAKTLAAIFMIIFFAIKSYELMSGDKGLEVTQLLRPFGLTMVIICLVLELLVKETAESIFAK